MNLTVSETISCLGEEGSNKKSIYILHYQGATLNMDGYIKSTHAKKKNPKQKLTIIQKSILTKGGAFFFFFKVIRH